MGLSILLKQSKSRCDFKASYFKNYLPGIKFPILLKKSAFSRNVWNSKSKVITAQKDSFLRTWSH